MSAIAAAAGAEILIPIAAKAGANLLKGILRRRVGGKGAEIAADAIDAVAGRLGTEATPEAIADAHTAEPARVETVIREVEDDFGEHWLAAYLDLLATDAKSDHWLQWAWRPMNGLLFGITSAAIGLTVCLAVLLKIPFSAELLPVLGLVGPVYGAWGTVIGVNVWQRSKEKIAGAAG